MPQSDVYHRTLRYPPKDYYAGSWSCGYRFGVRIAGEEPAAGFAD
jgi:hypothetical protein